MAKESSLKLGAVLLNALQRNPNLKLADLREEVLQLEDHLEQLIRQHGDETSVEDVFRRLPGE